MGVESGSEPLDAEVRGRLEGVLGLDLADLRVHSGPRASASAEAVHAEAYALGNHVVLRHPAVGVAGQMVLSHEAAHVAQQARAGAPILQRIVTGDITASSIDAGWARRLTPAEMVEQVAILHRQMHGLDHSSPEYEAAAANLAVLEDSERNRQARPEAGAPAWARRQPRVPPRPRPRRARAAAARSPGRRGCR